MPVIIFEAHDGARYEVDAPVGSNLMKVALANGLDGIVGECGGACSCATCHCYLDEETYDKLGQPGEIELDMLECVADPEDTSRLGCQVVVTEDMSGMVVRLPESQY